MVEASLSGQRHGCPLMSLTTHRPEESDPMMQKDLSMGDGKAGSYRGDLDHHLAQLHRNSDVPVLVLEDHRFNKVSDGVTRVQNR